MDKLLVDIYVPAINKSYDVYIPLKSKLYELVTLLSGAFTELSEGYFTALDDAVICDKATGIALNINMSAEELRLQNGSKLMLI